MKLQRAYTLKLYGTESKFDDLKWSAHQYSQFTNAFIEHLYFNDKVDFYSTKGLGLLGNQAQRKAQGIVKSKKSNEVENGHKKSVPVLKTSMCFANITYLGTHKHFNYRINFGVAFGEDRYKSRFLFAKKTRALKKALRQGWKLSNQCEVYQDPRSRIWYVHVFVSKEVEKATPQLKFIGIDVGINHAVATSEGYLANSLKPAIKKQEKRARQRRKHRSLMKNRKNEKALEVLNKNLRKNKKKKKSHIKQLLDKEAKKLIARGLATSSNLVVEDPKILANLRLIPSMVRWARSYFANRLVVLGKEYGVFVVCTHPAGTSKTCSSCLHKDKRNRKGLRFKCRKCGQEFHADHNAALNLQRKGQDFVDTYVLKTNPLKKKTQVSAVGNL